MKHESYFSDLLKSSRSTKKQVALYLSEEMLSRIDKTVELFAGLADSKSFSRNTLIEDAVQLYLEEAEEFLQEKLGVSVREEIQVEAVQGEKGFDTVVFSSNGCGFEETFLGGKEKACWYPCYCSADRLENTKYVAVYRATPVSAITHYAQVKAFRRSENGKYFICDFEGKPIELPHPVALGSKPNCFFRGAKYTTLESLKKAKTADQMIFG